MAYNTKEILKDKDLNPISQYFNPIADKYEVVEGANGGNKVILYNEDGTENNGLSLLPILDKLTQLTGTVIDENTRKSNELLRIALYNNIDNLLTTGQLKGDKGDTGNGLEFNWNGTQLGIRVVGQPSYTYVQLKGEKGDKGEIGETGSIDSLDSTHIQGALGFLPKDYTAGTNIDITGSTISATDTIATKTSIGLANVDNLKQMPISNGVLENYREKLNATTGVMDLSLGNVFTDTPNANRTYSITNAISGQAHSFTLVIVMDATLRTLTFPASVKWQGGEIPDMTTTSKTYVLTFVTVNGGTTWLGMSGGEF